MRLPKNTRDPRRDACDDLAAALGEPEGLRLARQLQWTGLLGRNFNRERVDRATLGWPRPISIWQPEEREGERVWVRPEPGIFGDHFATRRELQKKRSELPLRVVLLGESVAAGYLYAPALTPARVLEEQLLTVAGPAMFEVIDLARTNERIESLVDTLEASVQISPDMFVIFAGNNWNLLETPELSPYVRSILGRQELAAALREDGSHGALRLAREKLVRTAKQEFSHVADIGRAIGVPVIVVLPEVNLVDWETRQPVMWLAADKTPRWHETLARAQQAISVGDYWEALALGEQMLLLDDGSCATSHRVVARARLALGQEAHAHTAMLAEINSVAYPTLCFLGAPQATSHTRDLLSALSRQHGFTAVDLRDVFAQYTGTVLAGRRLFLDYCHLTREGMKVAMGAVCAEVLRLSGMAQRDWRSLVSDFPEPAISAEADATAKLGAALHTAHRLIPLGTKSSLLEYWCDEALGASGGIASAMLELMQARVAPSPAVLSAAQQKNLASSYRLTHQHGWAFDYFDADMIAAISRVLDRRGVISKEGITSLLLEHRAPQDRDMDLVEAPYPWEPLERFYSEAADFEDLSRPAMFRVPWPTASFAVMTDGKHDLNLDAVMRLPPIHGWEGTREGSITFHIGNHAVGTVLASERWTKRTLRIGRSNLCRGINRLTLGFPSIPPVGDVAWASTLDRLECGIAADLHPVFGELFSLRVRR